MKKSASFLVLLALLLVLSGPTFVSAQACQLVNNTLTSTDFCFAVLDGRNITSLSDVANINTLASEEAIAYTNGICDSDSCTATDVQGSADAACFENIAKLLCLKHARPVGNDDCASSDLDQQTIAQCEATFASCSSTVDSAVAVEVTECALYACVDDADCGSASSSGTCVTSNGPFNSTCDCAEGWMGSHCGTASVDCADVDCSFHGVCNFFIGECECDELWSGETCSNVPCENDCNGNGYCHNVGVCQCDMGFIGSSCNIVIEDAGMTSGELAGAIIGGLLVSFLVTGLAIFGCVAGSDN